MRPRRSAAKLSSIGGMVALVSVACGGREPPPKSPAPPPPPSDPPLLAKIAAACVRMSACTDARDTARFRDPSACVDWWFAGADATDTSDRLRRCLLESTSCENVSSCIHGGGDPKAAAFCSQRQGVVSGCDGDRLVSCGEDDAHESTVLDCARMGATCREVKAAGGLVVRACWSPQKCPAGAPEVRCEGADAVVSCHDGAFERVACRPGTVCEERRDEEGDRVASCELPGRRRCDVGGARHCEDGRLVECDRGGHFGKARVTDCAAFGLECAGIGPRAGCYVPVNVECDKELLPRCDGGAVVFCAAGRMTKVACSSVGFGSCDPSAWSPMAACVRDTARSLLPASTGPTPAK